MIGVVIFALNMVAASLVQFIPFEFEQKMVANFEFAEIDQSAQQAYLQEMADELASQMDLPKGMAITVHYSDSDVVNAFATVGGNLFFFRGLIDLIDSEDEMAAVMGHEIAHVKHRHPLVASR